MVHKNADNVKVKTTFALQNPANYVFTLQHKNEFTKAVIWH